MHDKSYLYYLKVDSDGSVSFMANFSFNLFRDFHPSNLSSSVVPELAVLCREDIRLMPRLNFVSTADVSFFLGLDLTSFPSKVHEMRVVMTS